MISVVGFNVKKAGWRSVRSSFCQLGSWVRVVEGAGGEKLDRCGINLRIKSVNIGMMINSERAMRMRLGVGEGGERSFTTRNFLPIGMVWQVGLFFYMEMRSLDSH